MSDQQAWLALLSALVAAGFVKHLVSAFQTAYRWVVRFTPEGQARHKLEISRINGEIHQDVIDRLISENDRLQALIESERQLWQDERQRLTDTVARLEDQVSQLKASLTA